MEGKARGQGSAAEPGKGGGQREPASAGSGQLGWDAEARAGSGGQEPAVLAGACSTLHG